MAIANHLKKKSFIKIDSDIYKVLEHQHIKPGKGGAFVKAKLQCMNKGKIFDKTFRSDEKVDIINISNVNANFLYENNDQLYFLNLENYEEYTINKNQLNEKLIFLTPDVPILLSLYDDQILEVNFPPSVNIEVTEAKDAVKGNTSINPSKVVTLSNGFEIKVPLFINQGDWISIDTKTTKYITRIQKNKNEG